MDGRTEADLELLLSAYADGELAPAERERVEAALARDPKLRSRLDDHRALGGALRAALEQEADSIDFAGFTEAVMARLPAERKAPLGERLRAWIEETLTFHRWQAVSALSFAVLLLVAGPILWSNLRPAAMEGPLLAGGDVAVLDVTTAEDTDAMLFTTASGTTVIYVQGN